MSFYYIIFSATALLIGVTIHEFSHALVATKLGDDTPKHMGRLTLNPVAHFDPFGALLFVLMIFGRSVIAYGKPVQVNPLRFEKVSMRTGMMLVSLAGPLSNVFVAFLFMLIANFAPLNPLSQLLFRTIIGINISLAVFNLLPVDPLDGEKIISGLLPYNYAQKFDSFQQKLNYNPQLRFLIFIMIIFNADILIVPIANLLLNLLNYIIVFINLFIGGR